MAEPTDLRMRVFAALDQGRENGYPLRTMPARAVAEDLNRCCPDLDTVATDVLVPFVREWQRKR